MKHALQMRTWLSRQFLSWRAANKGICSSFCFTTRTRFNFLQNSRFLQSHYSTVSAENVEYEYIDEVEDISRYQPGGYHPIHIDDRLNKRYRIVHKLGYGSYSTVWLAFDEKLGTYVAIKVGTSSADYKETNILSQMSQSPVRGKTWEDRTLLIPAVLDSFDVSGPNGTHPCLVTHPARCNLRDAKEASGNRLFQLDAARSLAAQLVMALSLIHDRGYAHGDLHLGNFFLQLPSSLDNLSVEELYARYGQPDKEPVVCLDPNAPSKNPSVPSYAITPAWLGAPSTDIPLSEAMLILSDFGVAFRPGDKSRFKSHTPLVMRPPESLFEPETPLTFASDIWSLGCVIFELLAHRSLISGYFLETQDEMTASQVYLQGPMPPTWWKKWDNRSMYFDEAGKPLGPPYDHWSWERKFREWVQSPRQRWRTDTLAEDELDEVMKLLQRMLAWKPSERLDIYSVLNSEWMTRWALPAYKKGLEARCAVALSSGSDTGGVTLEA